MISTRYPEVRYLHETNRGPAAARNLGLREARGELVALLDSDDLWWKGKVELEYQLLARHPEAEALAGNASAWVLGRQRTADTFAHRGIQFPGGTPRFFDWSMRILLLGPVCCTSSMTFRRSVLDRLGPAPFDETLRFDEDWDLEFRLFAGCKVLLYPQITCTSRVFDDGTRTHYTPSGKSKPPEEQRRIWRQQRAILERYLNNSHWDPETELAFRRRHEELGALVNAEPSSDPIRD
jgi:glycosyltransferase involved in cell wall biosynthesis